MGHAGDDADLLRIHAEVLFRFDAAGRLRGLNEPGDDPAPRLFLVRGTESTGIWFRHDVSDRVVAACRAIVADLPRWDEQQLDAGPARALRAALALDGPVTEESGGPAFRFPDEAPTSGIVEAVEVDEANAALLDRHFPYTRSILDARRPVIAIVADGAAVAACYSARQSPVAAEAGVATEPAYQGRGYASLVVAAWRRRVESGARLPLYSTTWTNAASRAVARKLGLIAYADTLSLT